MLELPGYQVVAQLHQGRTFTIRRAIRLSDDLPVIIKQLNPAALNAENLSRLQHEYQLISGLNITGISHPLLQESMGHSLTTVFADQGGIPVNQLIDHRKCHWHHWLPIAIRISEILEQIHEAGVTHKQINPYNILVNPETGHVEIVGFCFSTRLGKEQAD
ncbi:MAG: hypothetical protein V7629_00655 [Motiliproteus sp.]